jgi:endoplasmic reticulum lectin 1
LTIESPSLCEIINGPLDEYGIFNLKLHHGNKNEKIKITSEKEEEDKLKQHIEEHVLRKEVFHPLEQEAEESDKKKKLSKIEL